MKDSTSTPEILQSWWISTFTIHDYNRNVLTLNVTLLQYVFTQMCQIKYLYMVIQKYTNKLRTARVTCIKRSKKVHMNIYGLKHHLWDGREFGKKLLIFEICHRQMIKILFRTKIFSVQQNENSLWNLTIQHFFPYYKGFI